MMNGCETVRIGQFLFKTGSAVIGLLFALIAMFRDLFAASEPQTQDSRSLQDSDLIGDYNHRTQQFDSGTDPSGWYEDEP
jgi:hypothetical protein